VVISGAADIPMSALLELYGGFEGAAKVLRRLVKEQNLVDWDGNPVDPETYGNVSPRQLQWLRQCVEDAARNELLDPEA
jgi:hypothetical protein